MQYTLHNGKKVAFDYIRKGNKTTLVLLHGFCEDSTMWADFAPLLSKKYSLLMIDLSGFGQSDLLEESSMAAMSEAVQTVLEHLKIPNCILVGHSMGGYVGLEFAKQYPQVLQGLGLFHSHPFADTVEKITNRKKTIRFVQRHGVAPFAGQFVRNLFTANFMQNNPQFIEDLIGKTSTHHSDAFLAASQGMINRVDQSAVLQHLSCPVLFVVGKKDNAIPYANSLRQLSLPPVASVHIFEELGHMGLFEMPIKTAQIVNNFVAFCVE